ncbi:MAG: dihydroneopterin aldolase [Gammaproteobacteria bacterium]|nr:dihydroneopterin aldolase [Gammaproteobacteria bacterium]
MDIIFINELRVETVIGIYDWERRITQTISFDLELAADIRRARDVGVLIERGVRPS